MDSMDAFFADLLADPNHPYFGMENWGLMTFRSAFLLVKESESSVESVAWVAKVIAHEIAHQVCRTPPKFFKLLTSAIWLQTPKPLLKFATPRFEMLTEMYLGHTV